MTKEQEIKKFMTSLKISYAEAEELYNSDHSDDVLPEVKEMEKKAKQIKRYEKSDKKRKSTPKERKINPIKKELFTILEDALKSATIDYSTVNESELNFRYRDESFTVKLILHRPPKSQ